MTAKHPFKAYRPSILRLVILAASLLGFVTQAQNLDAEPARLALVVGNSAYEGDIALKNPVNDANDFAAALMKAGWQVTLITDADRRSFNRAISGFRSALATQAGSNALFYYAGHGVQIDGNNYLIPVKMDFESTDDIKTDAIAMSSVTDSFEDANVGVSLIVLDACRDNPFARKATRSVGGTRGLSVVQSGGGAKGSAIMFSTSPGDVALDGTGRNGIFTAALLKYIDSDLKLEDLFRKVTAEVRAVSGDTQKPWINASLSADFYFLPDAVRASRAAEVARQAEATRQAELVKATDVARSVEALKTEQARLEAEAARKAAADAQAVSAKLQSDAAAKEAAELARPKGKARFESRNVGQVYAGTVLLGEVSPESPLIAEALSTGNQEFRFISSDNSEETKAVTISDKAYVTVFFGKPPAALLPAEVLGFSDTDELTKATIVKLRLFGEKELKKVDPFEMQVNRLGAEERNRIFANLKKDEALGYAVWNLIPFAGAGNFMQGNKGYGFYQIGSATFAIGMFLYGTINGVPEGSEGQLTGTLLLSSLVNFAISYVGGVVQPFLYENRYNKSLRKALLLDGGK